MNRHQPQITWLSIQPFIFVFLLWLCSVAPLSAEIEGASSSVVPIIPKVSAKGSTLFLALVKKDPNAPLHWVNSEIEPAIAWDFQNIAKSRGIAMMFPLYDLSDASIMNEEQIWGNDFSSLEKVTERYQAETLFIAKISKDESGGWEAQWTLVKNDDVKSWATRQSDFKTLLNIGMEELAVNLRPSTSLSSAESSQLQSQAQNQAQSQVQNQEQGQAQNQAQSQVQDQMQNPAQLSVQDQIPAQTQVQLQAPLQQGQVEPQKSNLSASTVSNASNDNLNTKALLKIAVSGIIGEEQYAKILEYLRRLPSVEHVEVAKISPEQTLFQIDTSMDAEAIIQSIAVDHVLEEVPSLDAKSTTAAFHYRVKANN